MSYDLTAKSMSRMIVQLTILKENTLSKVEFKGNKTFARNLRQAMVAAEYIRNEEFGGLNRKWKISYQTGDKIICTVKKVENFREFKYIDNWPMAQEMVAENQDAYVLVFPNMTPDNTDQAGIDIMMKPFPAWKQHSFNDKGLVLNRPYIIPGKEEEYEKEMEYKQEKERNPLYIREK